MRLQINGESTEYGGSPRLNVLLRERGVDSARVAILVNDEVVPRTTRDEWILADGDCVEILIFAGGG